MNNNSSSASWKAATDADGILWLTLDKPGTSAERPLERCARGTRHAAATAAAGSAARVVVISAKKSGSIAGADIKEFTGITDAESGYRLIHAGQQVLDRLEALPCPTVAAIHGFALGGGCELRWPVVIGSLSATNACRWVPGVLLGIHPGFGGTVRSVRIAGVRPSMELMLTGKSIRAETALRIGLIDKLVTDQEQLQAAARDFILRRPPPRKAPLGERILSSALVRPFVRRALTAQVAAKARREHYPAPYAIVDLWARYGAHGAEAFEGEARSIAQLFTTETSRNLVRCFCCRIASKPWEARPRPTSNMCTSSCGVMGGDIAAWSALRGFTVTLQDQTIEYVEPALNRAKRCSKSGSAIRTKPRPHATACAPMSPAWAWRKPTSSSRRSSRTSRPSRSCMRASSRA